MSVLLIYAAVSRFSFLGGGVTAPSDFSFLVSRSSFLVSRFSFIGGGVTGPLVYHNDKDELNEFDLCTLYPIATTIVYLYLYY